MLTEVSQLYEIFNILLIIFQQPFIRPLELVDLIQNDKIRAVDHLCIIKQFKPAFRFRALFSRDLKFRKHIGKALRILRFGDIGKHT